MNRRLPPTHIIEVASLSLDLQSFLIMPSSNDSNERYEKYQKPQKTPSSTRVWYLLLCAVAVYGICQLDVSVLSLESVLDGSSAATNNNPKPILQISVLGERNSGTRWTWGYVKSDIRMTCYLSLLFCVQDWISPLFQLSFTQPSFGLFQSFH